MDEQIVHYSINVVLKSGKTVASDPVECYWEKAQSQVLETTATIQEDAFTTLTFIRNGRLTIVLKSAIDYVEFITDLAK